MELVIVRNGILPSGTLFDTQWMLQFGLVKALEIVGFGNEVPVNNQRARGIFRFSGVSTAHFSELVSARYAADK